MRKLFLVIVFILVFIDSIAWAASNKTFEWDRNTEPDIKGYRLYQSDTPFAKDVTPARSFQVGEDVLHPINVITILVEDGKWYWVATAFDNGGNESGPSNEIIKIVDSVPPAPPQNLIDKVLEKIAGCLKSFFRMG